MKLWAWLVLGVAMVTGANGADEAAAFEADLRERVANEKVTIVHFWAPWCGNCRREMEPEGWARFVEKNPDVQVIFVNAWHRGMDPQPRLRDAQLGGQANFVALTHPIASSKAGEKLDRILDLPMIWVPTTWVFRAGKQRYALNYGEVRFEMLQQMVDDAGRKW